MPGQKFASPLVHKHFLHSWGFSNVPYIMIYIIGCSILVVASPSTLSKVGEQTTFFIFFSSLGQLEGKGGNFAVFVLSSFAAAPNMGGYSRWIKPEIYPLLAPVAAVVGLCTMQLVRNIYTNPEVRVTKENRAAGVLNNFEEGEYYAQHRLRQFLRGRRPEVMPSVNKFFSDPN